MIRRLLMRFSLIPWPSMTQSSASTKSFMRTNYLTTYRKSCAISTDIICLKTSRGRGEGSGGGKGSGAGNACGADNGFHGLPSTVLMMGLFTFLWNHKNLADKNDTTDVDTVKLPPSIKQLVFKANKALTNLDYVEADALLHEALEMLDNSENSATKPFLEAKAVIMDKLGNMYLQSGEWDKGAKSLTAVISYMMMCGVDNDSSPIIELSLKISKAYVNLNRFEDAKIGFEWCHSTARKLLNNDKTSENYSLLGIVCQAKGQFCLLIGEAENAYKSFLLVTECAKAVFGERHYQVAVSMSDEATALSALGKFQEASYVLTVAIEILEAEQQSVTSDEYNESMAILLLNLAEIQKSQGKYLDSIELSKRSNQHALKLDNQLLINKIKEFQKKSSLQF